MKKSIYLMMASGMAFSAGESFGQGGTTASLPTGGTSGTIPTGTTTATVPTAPAPAAVPATATPVKITPQATQVRVPVVPVVQKPDLNGILRNQAGNIQALKGAGIDGKPTFQPSGTSGQGNRKPAVNPKPALGSDAIKMIGVGNISLTPANRQTVTVRYEKQTIKRAIKMDKTPTGVGNSSEEDEEEEFKLDDLISDSSINDLLTTEMTEPEPIDLSAARENALNNLKENLEGKIDEVGGLVEDNRATDDFMEDFGSQGLGRDSLGDGFFAGIRDSRNNGRFTGDGLAGMYGAFNEGVTGRAGGKLGRSGTAKDPWTYSEYKLTYGLDSNTSNKDAYAHAHKNGHLSSIYLITDNAAQEREESQADDEAYAIAIGLLDAELKAAEAKRAEKERKAKEEELQKRKDEVQKLIDEANGNSDDDGDANERTVLGGESENPNNAPAWARNAKRDRALIGNNAPGGNTIRIGEGSSERAGQGPLERDPTSGDPTLRFDSERLTDGEGNLERLDHMLNNPTIHFGGEDGSDPRGTPKPQPGGEGTAGGPVISPGVNYNSAISKTGVTGSVEAIEADVKSAVKNIQINQNAITK